jgi:hypothetical protein
MTRKNPFLDNPSSELELARGGRSRLHLETGAHRSMILPVFIAKIAERLWILRDPLFQTQSSTPMSHLRLPGAIIWSTLRALEIFLFGPQTETHS